MFISERREGIALKERNWNWYALLNYEVLGRLDARN